MSTMGNPAGSPKKEHGRQGLHSRKGSVPPKNDGGTYLLILEMGKSQKVKPGRLAEANFKRGIYIYVGRAKRGLKARIRRHIREEKKSFWHIDYLLHKAKIIEVWTRENYFGECQTASKIRQFLPAFSTTYKGFGSSDCRCPGHLLPASSSKRGVRILLQKLGFHKVAFNGDTF
jgi:Uri superfamily endonuclease